MDRGARHHYSSVGGGDAGMSCETCASWNLKSAGAMAKQGMGNCAHLPRYQFVALGCERIKPAEASVVEARMAWLGKLQINPTGGHKKT